MAPPTRATIGPPIVETPLPLWLSWSRFKNCHEFASVLPVLWRAWRESFRKFIFTSRVRSPNAAVLDALDSHTAMLLCTIRDMSRRSAGFFTIVRLHRDYSLEPPDTPLQAAVASGAEPLLIIGRAQVVKADRFAADATGLQYRKQFHNVW